MSKRVVATRATQDIQPYAFNRDLATPMSAQDHAVYAVGLFPDIPCRRWTYGTYGHNEFDQGLALGWLSKQEADGARWGSTNSSSSVRETTSFACPRRDAAVRPKLGA